MTIPRATRREPLRVGQANSDTWWGPVRISKWRKFKRLYPVGPTSIPTPQPPKSCIHALYFRAASSGNMPTW